MAMTLIMQKQKMLEYQEQLKGFCKSLDSVLGNMDSKLRELVYSGLPEDIFDYYVEYYYGEEAKAINDLVETIESDHQKYINDVVSDIDAALSRK